MQAPTISLAEFGQLSRNVEAPYRELRSDRLGQLVAEVDKGNYVL